MMVRWGDERGGRAASTVSGGRVCGAGGVEERMRGGGGRMCNGRKKEERSCVKATHKYSS
jgi:hypothetical protein